MMTTFPQKGPSNISLVLSDWDVFGQADCREQEQRDKNGAVQVVSLLYGIVLSLLGFILPLSEAVEHGWLNLTYGAIFVVYIYVVGTVFVIYWEVVNSYCRAEKPADDPTRLEHISISNGYTNGVAPQSTEKRHKESTATIYTIDKHRRRHESDLKFRKGLAQKYGHNITVWSKSAAAAKGSDDENEDTSNRIIVDLAKLKNVFATHETNAYLKFALLVFFAGNIIYIFLEIYYYVAEIAYSCDYDQFGWTYFIRLIFTICQTLFFFRGTKNYSKKQLPIIRLGLMHLIGTNLAVWFRTLVNEVVHAMEDHNAPANLTGTNDSANTEMCLHLNQMLATISPYLFPFVMEYSLTVLGMTAIMIRGLEADIVNSFKNLKYVLKLSRYASETASQIGSHFNSKADSWSIDSHKVKNSNIGAFVGGLYFTVVISCLIVVAVQLSHDSDNVTPTITYTADMVFNGCLIVACIATHHKMQKNFPRVERAASVDDVLLIIAMTGAIFFQLSVAIPTARYMITTEVTLLLQLTLACAIVAMVQHLLQTIVLLAAMRSYSQSMEEAMKYPARQLLTFLAFSNVSMWIYHMLSWQQVKSGIDHEFSSLVWMFLLQLSLPFLLFYHFHCSVCFVDIWHSAYRPLGHRIQPCVVDVDTKSNGDQNNSNGLKALPAPLALANNDSQEDIDRL